MGYLTHITIYNDGAHRLDQLSPADLKKLARDLYEACLADREDSYAVENFANMINAQRPRHADDECLYLHWGNYLQCLDGQSIQRLVAQNPDLLEKILKRLKNEVKFIKRSVDAARKMHEAMPKHEFSRGLRRRNECRRCYRPLHDPIHTMVDDEVIVDDEGPT